MFIKNNECKYLRFFLRIISFTFGERNIQIKICKIINQIAFKKIFFITSFIGDANNTSLKIDSEKGFKKHKYI